MRRRRELRALGNVVRLAVTDPDALEEALANPEPEAFFDASKVETERWW